MTARDIALTKAPARLRKTRAASADLITVGKDVLELLSSAMYVDPLTIYREYVQNAADAVDTARDEGILELGEPGRVEIDIDVENRAIRIRDNGSGIPASKAASVLLSIGASGKRGTKARGFRGVGRLAGLAYARQLTFRTRAVGDGQVTEVIWDCLKLKSTLRDVTQNDDLPGVMERIVTIAEIDGDGYPDHFFEVELTNVVRLRKDVLLNAQMVGAYLAQVAPVPFPEAFSAGATITDHLRDHVRMADLQICIGSEALPITRPHTDAFQVSETVTDRLKEIQLLSFENDGEIVALGWVMHHGYKGHIGLKAQVGGLRLRAGNIQVGGTDLLDEIFPEARFNGWCVGEIHILDPRILPNARRDNFEQNVHYLDLIGRLLPEGRALAKQCRAASVERHKIRRELIADVAAIPEALPSSPAAFAPSTKRICAVEASNMSIGDSGIANTPKIAAAVLRLSNVFAELNLPRSELMRAIEAALPDRE